MGPFRLADWIVDPRLGTLRRPGDGSRNPVDPEPDPNKDSRGRLEPKVMGVLLCLAERAGQVVSKRELLDTVWPGTHVQEVALSRSISEIRRRLGDDARQPTFIETLPKRGYRLLVPVEPAEPSLDAASAEPAPPVVTEPAHAARGGARFWPWLALAALIATLWLLLGWTSHPHDPSVMVLPLRNLSGDPDSDYFSAGLSEELVTRLWKIEGLRVKTLGHSPNGGGDSFTFDDPLVLAGNAGVTTVVEGSVRREGKGLRVAVRLVDVASGDILWAEAYDREVHDLLVIQQDIARRIAAALVAARYQLGKWDEAGRWQSRRWPRPFDSGDSPNPGTQENIP